MEMKGRQRPDNYLCTAWISRRIAAIMKYRLSDSHRTSKPWHRQTSSGCGGNIGLGSITMDHFEPSERKAPFNSGVVNLTVSSAGGKKNNDDVSNPPFNPSLLDPSRNYVHGHGEQETQQHTHVARPGRGNRSSPPHLLHTENDEAYGNDECEHCCVSAREVWVRWLIPSIEHVVRNPAVPTINEVFDQDDRAEGGNPVSDEACA